MIRGSKSDGILTMLFMLLAIATVVCFFIPSVERSTTLTIGGMAFQDAWNIDLLRVKRCSIQIIQKDGRLIPLCSKYLSSVRGEKLFPGIG